MEWPSPLSLCPQGASILRMLRDWITPDLFQKGCQVRLAPKYARNAAHPPVTVAKPLFKKLISEILVLVEKVFNSFQYRVDNVKWKKFHAPKKQECELHEDFIACQWGPKFMTAFSGETSSTLLLSCCQLGSLTQFCAASYGHSAPTHPSLLCTLTSYKLIRGLRLDAGAPSPREPR